MFVQPSRLKAQGAALSTVFALGALGACDDPTASTDLRPEGGPEILTVTVMNDPGNFVETATFCKVGDEKRPGFVGVPVAQICDADLAQPAGFRDPTMLDANGDPIFVPAKVTDAIPTSWYVRVMFDELIDPDVEELVEILEDTDNNPDTPDIGIGEFTGTLINTQPVTLQCTDAGGTPVNVAYDGYYSPSGNRVTWPLGPSIVVQPTIGGSVLEGLKAVPTGATCTIAAKPTLVDKDEVAVPDPANAEYSWSISPLEFVESDPAPEAAGDEAEITADSPLALVFNAFIDPASLAAGEVTIQESATCADLTGAVAKTAAIDGSADDGVITIAITNPAVAGNAWNVDKAYTITFTADNAVTDVAGGPGALPGAADFTLCFTTVAP